MSEGMYDLSLASNLWYTFAGTPLGGLDIAGRTGPGLFWC